MRFCIRAQNPAGAADSAVAWRGKANQRSDAFEGETLSIGAVALAAIAAGGRPAFVAQPVFAHHKSHRQTHQDRNGQQIECHFKHLPTTGPNGR